MFKLVWTGPPVDPPAFDPPAEIPGTTCDDGLDNDCDGLSDCDDPDCSTDPACAPSCGDGTCDPPLEDPCNCPADCGSPPPAEIANLTCDDGVDNDCDGDVDCLDSDCASDPSCQFVCGNGICEPPMEDQCSCPGRLRHSAADGGCGLHVR